MDMITRTPQRVEHQNGRRMAQVVFVDPITPRMRRITLGGPDLAGFSSAAADDHVKLFFPAPGELKPQLPMPGPGGMRPSRGGSGANMRDYTPRRFDPARLELVIEFVVHGDGPASNWAAHAKPGDWIGIGGPRGSMLIPDYDGYLLIGDETALPAISRRLEEMPPGKAVCALIEVADQHEKRHLTNPSNAEVIWLFRDGAPLGTAALFDKAVRSMRLPLGDVHAWIAGEIDVARQLRQYLIDERGFTRAQIKAAGYWRHGQANAHGRIDD
jgi:NADPH-dependent ferric siderophore reductase